MNKFLRLPTLLIWLTSLWVALWADLTVGNVLGGLIVALAVVGVARPTGVTGLERTNFRPISALVYAAYFLWQLLKANFVVAWEIITPRLKLNRAIIAVPMHTTSAGVVTLIANSVTLTPGTLTIYVAEEFSSDGDIVERTLFVHVLHFIDVESVRRDVLQLERRAIKAFGAAPRARARRRSAQLDQQLNTRRKERCLMIFVAIVFLAVAAGCFLYRLLRGPSTPDRVVALDGVLSVVVSGIVVAAAKANSDIILVTVLVVSLVGFVGTVALGRFVERRGG